MVALDRRLFPLFEALNRSNLDWLVLEIIEGLELGEEPEASEDELAAARENVRLRFDAQLAADHLLEEDARRSQPRKEISGDDQIVWASNYVQERLSNAIDDLRYAAGNLEQLMWEGKGAARVSANVEAPFVAVVDDDRSGKVNRAGLIVAIQGIFALRKALDAWSEQVRQGGQA